MTRETPHTAVISSQQLAAWNRMDAGFHLLRQQYAARHDQLLTASREDLLALGRALPLDNGLYDRLTRGSYFRPRRLSALDTVTLALYVAAARTPERLRAQAAALRQQAADALLAAERLDTLAAAPGS